jgi:hypothetical protein
LACTVPCGACPALLHGILVRHWPMRCLSFTSPCGACLSLLRGTTLSPLPHETTTISHCPMGRLSLDCPVRGLVRGLSLSAPRHACPSLPCEAAVCLYFMGCCPSLWPGHEAGAFLGAAAVPQRGSLSGLEMKQALYWGSSSPSQGLSGLERKQELSRGSSSASKGLRPWPGDEAGASGGSSSPSQGLPRPFLGGSFEGHHNLTRNKPVEIGSSVITGAASVHEQMPIFVSPCGSCCWVAVCAGSEASEAAFSP